LAEILKAEQLLGANDLRAAIGGTLRSGKRVA
jgi:hypothetical protein